MGSDRVGRAPRDSRETGDDMSGWHPIETAPKDGTHIDIWMNGKRYADVFWSFSRKVSTGERIDDPIWDGWAWDGTVGMSYTPNYVPGKGERATDWMPIPEPPSVRPEKP